LNTDNPFALTGGLPEGGSYSGPGVTGGIFDPSIGPGSYEITYTYSDGEDCEGSTTEILEVRSVESLRITKFVLVDADTETDLMQLTQGMVIEMRNLPTLNLNIRAEATEDTESVVLELDGAKQFNRTENVTPYALFGDLSGDYIGNLLPIGSYTLTAQAFEGNNASGAAGPIELLDFEVVMSDANNALSDKSMMLSPNAATSNVQVQFSKAITLQSAFIFDMTARLIHAESGFEKKASKIHSLKVDLLPEGIYSLRVIDDQGRAYFKRLIVRRE
jgi:hypothetical protein